jgi:hypothetical protein
MERLTTIFAAALLAAALPATAGVDAPKHGGIVKEVREVSYELVARPDAIAIFITDHGKPVASAGASAKVTLLNGADKSEASLAPAGDNKLEAKGSFKVQKGTKAIAVITLAGKAPVTARYDIAQPAN